MEVIDIFFRSCFLGFAFWTLAWLLTKHHQLVGERKDEIDLFIVRMVILAGSMQLLFFLSKVLFFGDGGLADSLKARAYGEYRAWLWIYVFTCLVLPQVLWITKIRMSKLSRAIIAGWILLVMNFEQFVILLTSLHRDYSPGAPASMIMRIIINWLISLAIFVAFVAAGLKAKEVLRRDR
jgi:hypothetical protein